MSAFVEGGDEVRLVRTRWSVSCAGVGSGGTTGGVHQDQSQDIRSIREH